MVDSDRITVITDSVSALIRAFRKREGVTRAELAASAWEHGAPASFTATVIGHLETGRRSAGGRRREITLDELVFLAKAMGTTPVALLAEHAAELGIDQPAVTECTECAGRTPGGSLEARVRADLEEFGDLDSLTMEPSLAATAYALAERIDAGGGEGGKQLPQLVKELRATIEQLIGGRRAPGGDDDADGDDDLDGLDEPE